MNNRLEMKTWRIVLLLVLSIIGAAIAAHLTSLHIRHLITGQASACDFTGALGTGWNCDVVNTSEWSEVAGVPVSHVGFLFYLLVMSLSIAAFLRPAARAGVHGVLLVLAGGALLVSLLLAFVSLSVLKAYCVFCMSLYAVNAVLFGALVPGGRAALAALPALGQVLLRPLIGLLVLAWFASAGLSAWQLRGTARVARAVADAKAAREQAERAQAAATKNQTQPATPPATEPRVDLTAPELPTRGPQDAPVTIVEISDFECPFCQKASGTLEELLEDPAYRGKLRVQFRHFPLDPSCNALMKKPLHDNACAAARAAVCAASPKTGGSDEKFWAYAKKLFAGDVEAADLTAHAKALSLDAAAFAACQNAPDTAQVVTRDLQRAVESGVTAVPVFFINGRRLAGAQPAEKFRQLIDEALAPAKTP